MCTALKIQTSTYATYKNLKTTQNLLLVMRIVNPLIVATNYQVYNSFYLNEICPYKRAKFGQKIPL